MSEYGSDEFFMERALQEALRAYDQDEVPIGAVIVSDGKIIARGYNQVETLKDATAHAEIIAITAAANQFENWRLDSCTLYVTLEPCPMCAGAILNSRIGRVVYAARDERLGACVSHFNILQQNPIRRDIVETEGVLKEEAIHLLKAFFQEKRKAQKQRPKLKQGETRIH